MTLLLLFGAEDLGGLSTVMNFAGEVEFDFVVHNLKRTTAHTTIAVTPAFAPLGVGMVFPVQVEYDIDDYFMRKVLVVNTTFEIVPTISGIIVGGGWGFSTIRINNGAVLTYSRNLQVMLNVYDVVGGDYVYPDRFRWKEGVNGAWSPWLPYGGTYTHPQYFNVTASADGYIEVYAEVGYDAIDGEPTPVTETDTGLASDTIYLMTGTIIVSDDITVVPEEERPEEPPLPGVRRPRRRPIGNARRADIKARRRRIG